ncbi:putative glucosidase [Phytophthora cinnamomi]|uniref:putative glucosidase n=1 Tax=Phytophthora cinnamomi TaxID=4785 RepID=UPI00355AC036|nr:putative glucosidase [Phytophthora cinnamomi]
MALQRLATSLALLSLGVRASDWRGISPELQLKLSAASSFTCDDGLQRLELSRINDNYCDCADGSDEPGTSACSHTAAVFHCANAGFFAADVPTSRVNDGVCDCCDGSDEYASGAGCAPDCAARMESFRAGKKGLIEQVEAGLKDRVALAAEAQKLWDEQQQKQKEMEAAAASLRVMAEQLEARKEQEEKLEREEKQSRVQASKREILSQLGLLELSKEQLAAVILEVGRSGVSAKHELLPIIRKEREAAREGDEELPKTPMEQQDEEFKVRDEARQKETRRIEKLIEEKEKEEERKAQEAKEALEKAAEAAEAGEAAETAAPETEAPVAVDEEQKEEEDLTLPEVETRPIDKLYEELSASERYERSQALVTRKQHEDTKKELEEKEKELSDAQKVLEKDYGVDHVFFALRDKCVESDAGQYQYKICFFGKATQDHTKLGEMEDFEKPKPSDDEGSADDASASVDPVVEEIKFSNGQKCWNGPNRSLTVKLECGPEPMELFNIEEPSTCVYSAKLRTPAVCSEGDRERIMKFDSATVTPHHIEIEVPATL